MHRSGRPHRARRCDPLPELPMKDLLGLLAATLTTVAFLPQVLQTIRTRDTKAISLPLDLSFAAGLVKGTGFAREDEALAAVERGDNIIPGWRSVPALVGPLEIGSFTRYPRLGNPGTVVWRDPRTRSTQNRVGLRNPGARAAAA